MELAEEFSRIDGVEAVILYGSHARGDFHEGSDVDLLIVFGDQESYEEGWRRVMDLTARRDIFVQAVTVTVEELRSSTLLPSILREGKVLYSKASFDLQSLIEFKPHVLITYSLTGLSSCRKVKFVQGLYGRRSGKYTYEGVLSRIGGLRIGRSCRMVPMEKMEEAIRILDSEGVSYTLRHVWFT